MMLQLLPIKLDAGTVVVAVAVAVAVDVDVAVAVVVAAAVAVERVQINMLDRIVDRRLYQRHG